MDLTCDRQPRTLIHILDDDSLLHIFSFCRPVILDESEAVNTFQILGGGGVEARMMVVQGCRLVAGPVLPNAVSWLPHLQHVPERSLTRRPPPNHSSVDQACTNASHPHTLAR